MANVDTANGFTPVRLLSGGSGAIPTVDGKLAASQTIAAGDVIVIASGLIELGASNSALILGVAAEACTASSEGDTLLYYPAVPWIEFEAQCSGTYSNASNFVQCDVEGATGVMEINENASTEDVFLITGYNPNSEVGANTRARGIFIRSSYYPVLAAQS